jgi:hypothetical protein
MMRRLCAAATRSTAAPWRSACTAISDAPPTAIAKKAVASSLPAQQRAARHAEADGEGDSQRDPAEVPGQDRQHGRAEVQAQRGADGPLPRFARLHGRGEARAQHARDRRREQRADHPRQRRVEDDAGLRRREGQRQREQERLDQNTQSFSAGISSQ